MAVLHQPGLRGPIRRRPKATWPPSRSPTTHRRRENVVTYVASTVAAVILGFLAGLLTFKQKQRWCPGCGSILRCVACPGQPTPNEARRAQQA